MVLARRDAPRMVVAGANKHAKIGARKNIMKKIMSAVVVVLLSALVSSQAQSTQYGAELRGSVNTWVPAFDLYDYAYGVEVEYRNWFWDPVGFALSAGISSWEAKGGSSGVDKAVLNDISGQLTAIPVGPSIIYKIADMTDWNLTTEAGVRYVFAQSAIDYKRADADGSGTLDVDGGVIAVLGLDYERYFGVGKSFFVGAGYQIDLEQGAIQVSDVANQDNQLEAFFARVGTKIQF
jgi:hypothetical protein